MNDDIKKELDQIGDLVDSKIEKAFNSAQENAKGEIEESLKSEISNLSNEYLAKNDEMQKRMDMLLFLPLSLERRVFQDPYFLSNLVDRLLFEIKCLNFLHIQ